MVHINPQDLSQQRVRIPCKFPRLGWRVATLSPAM
jgi:hypothetical protein